MILSVLMATYDKDNPAHLGQALDSLLNQTRSADEVIIVEDGPINACLRDVLDAYSLRMPLFRVKVANNSGLQVALAAGLDNCKGEFVARMDSDDICVPTRFERQLRFLNEHHAVDVLGGAIAEFQEDSTQIDSVRRLPYGGEHLFAFAKLRNPMNHMTVMFRKDKVVQAGGYRTTPPFEDYELWVRMLLNKSNLCNLEDVLVLVRCGNGMQGRRGGLRYVQREISFVRAMRRIGFLSPAQSVLYLILHIPLRLVPQGVRTKVYRTFLRQNRGSPVTQTVKETTRRFPI